ncbi:MAG: TIGR00730 family Rossman fold protein [Chthoniobacterales bacterium]
MKSVCIYCGANEGNSPFYAETAMQCGSVLAARNLTLVYGGGNIGLMGQLADGALAAKGKVIGVIPEALMNLELGHKGVTELIVVDSMHARKQRMADLADAFIALPGGIGTLEELIEVFTWLQLNFHHKPVGLLNAGNYYAPLITLLDHMESEGFLLSNQREMLFVDDDISRLLDRMKNFERPQADKWISRRSEI